MGLSLAVPGPRPVTNADTALPLHGQRVRKKGGPSDDAVLLCSV
jgi:hypothetical protein